MAENAQKQQFEQWLPFYVNGRLGEAETAWMKQYLQDHPETEANLTIEQALKETLQTDLPNWVPEQGLDTLMNRIRTEPNAPVNNAIHKKSVSWLDRFLTALSPSMQNPRWALAITLLVVQTGIIGLLVSQRTTPMSPEYTEWRSPGTTVAYQGPVLQITFKSNATEEAIRLLMVKINGVFLGGPGQLGNYLVKVPPEHIEEAKNQVLASAIIESVQVLPEMPYGQ